MSALATQASEMPKVLIADDDPAIVNFLADRCRSIGFQVDTAANGMQLLIKARKTQPDVLIVDVNMPTLDGISASVRLIDTGKPFEVIVLTGSNNPEIAERCESIGMLYSRKGPNAWNEIAQALREIFPHLAQQIGAQPAAEDAVAEIPTRPRVLLVDDDPAVAKFLESRLAKHGIDTLTASNAVEAYRLARRHLPSAIVTDYDMPEGDALFLLGRLRETAATAKIPVIVLSGRNIDNQTALTLKREIFGHAGASKIVSKAFDVRELFEALQEFCAFDNATAAG